MEPAVQKEADPYRGASIVLFDGVCVMCNGVVRFLLKKDREKRFLFAPLQGAFARDVLWRNGKNADDLDTIAVVVDHALPSERVFTRSGAILHVLEAASGPWRLLAVLLGVLPAPLLEWGYNLFARHRYQLFGRHDTCPLPPPEQRARFVGQSESES